MPLPLILGIGAAIAGAAGIGSGIHGAVKMKDTKDTAEIAQYMHEKSIKKFEECSDITNKSMDNLGKKELEILKSFEIFSEIFEKIKNKPKFKDVIIEGASLPEYDAQELRDVSVGAAVLLGGLGGAAVGTAGGFAAAGATTAAVTALGTASTGTAISSLSGAAATKATLAILGGGAKAIGGGGIALGTSVLGAATLGVGLLVGGVIFNFTGSKLSDQADEAWHQARKEEEKVNKICEYLNKLKALADKYLGSLNKVNTVYKNHLGRLENIVETEGRDDYNRYTAEEKLLLENTVLLVKLLYSMCKVKLVLKADKEGEINTLNSAEVNKSINNANVILENIS